MLESILYTTEANISLGDCGIGIVVAIILGVVISLTHKFTTRSTENFFVDNWYFAIVG